MARPVDPNSTTLVKVMLRIRPISAIWLDQFAHEYDLYRTEVVKVCMAVAKRHAAEVAAGCAQLKALKDGERAV